MLLVLHVRRTLFIGLAGLLGLTQAAAAADTRSLTEQIEKLVSVPALSGMRIGIRIETLGPARQVVFQQDADQPFKPASNQKLVTTAAGLALLPRDFAYRTMLARRGDDLVIIGAGDPSVGDPRMARQAEEPITALFLQWARELKARGMTSVPGDLLYDDSIFDDEFLNPLWVQDKFNLQAWYTAPIGGLNFNDNCVDVIVRPGSEPGQPANVRLSPDTPFVRLRNTARTASTGEPIIARTSLNPYTISVSGSVSKPGDDSGISISISDPGEFFAVTCRSVLEAEGITIRGQTRRQQVLRTGPGAAALPADVQVLHVFERPLTDLLWRINKSSLNMFAEGLLKTMGAYQNGRVTAVGTTEGGREAVLRFLGTFDLPLDECVIGDGSGLTHSNRMTPDVLVAVLRYMDTHPRRDDWMNSLAVPGEPGTLRSRMRNLEGKVFAKTGYIRGVSALSGYVEGQDGRRYAFSVLCNETGAASGGLSAARTLQDSICRTLAAWSPSSSPAGGG